MSQSSLESLDFRAAADSASDLIFVAENRPNTSGGPLICYANAAMLAQFGIAADSIVGQRADFWSGPRSDPIVLVRLRAAMIAMTAAEGELRCYRPDGSTFWSDWRGHGFFEHANNCMRWMAIGRNTDERRRAEDELVMLSTAIEHANDAVFVYAIRAGDAVPRIRYVNSAGLRYSGYTKEELQTAKHLGPNENSDMAEITTEMLAGRPMTKRMRLYRKDGSDYWAHLSFQPIRDRLGTFSQWVCVERNISDIVEREEMRSDLMAMIGHDLRNPLQSILGFSELLLEDLAPQAAEYDAVVSDGLKIPTFDGLRIPSP